MAAEADSNVRQRPFENRVQLLTVSENGHSDGEAGSIPSRLLDDGTLWRLQYFQRLQRAAALVLDRCGDPVGLQAAASSAGMNPSAFSRYFAEKAGITFSHFRKVMRIERALRALESSDCTIAELADICGCSTATFSKSFKEILGVPPSEYRRRFLRSRQMDAT